MQVRRGRAGYTILELVISVTLLAIVIGAAQSVSFTGNDAYESASLVSRADGRVSRAAERIATELLLADADTLVPDPIGEFGSDFLEFKRVSEVTPTGVTWTKRRRLSFEYEAGEVDDGVDNDGDGIIDEGVIVLTRDLEDDGTGGRTVVICKNVTELLEGEDFDGEDDNGNDLIDERGFNIHRVGDLLTIRITVEERSEDGESVVRTVETSVRLRN